MSRGRSTARRYRGDNGPVVFGIPGLDVRWNRDTSTIVIALDDGSGAGWCQTGELAEMLIVALAARHRQGRLRETLQDMLRGVSIHLAAAEFYRCGRLMCWRPASQDAAP